MLVPPCGTFHLALSGSRGAPDLFALELARELPGRFKPLMQKVETGLFEHYTPYKEAGSTLARLAAVRALILQAPRRCGHK